MVTDEQLADWQRATNAEYKRIRISDQVATDAEPTFYGMALVALPSLLAEVARLKLLDSLQQQRWLALVDEAETLAEQLYEVVRDVRATAKGTQ